VSSPPEEELTGGGMSTVLRRGEVVLRGAGAWTPRVHQLLDHLHGHGFDACPRVIGTDDQGRELLTYLPGEVVHPPVPSDLLTDDVLIEAARMLRALHDASTGLTHLRDGWRFAPVEPVEVICHNDFAPYNVVFVADRPVGVIDFDTARPGSRIWDVAYAVFCWARLEPGAPFDADEQWRRAGVFCAGYGVGTDGILDTVQSRLVDMIKLIITDPQLHRQRTEQHDLHYRACLAHVRTSVADAAGGR